MNQIDITYDMRTDANGKDPDKYSATLRKYHRILWSKTLPNGKELFLDESIDPLNLDAIIDGKHFYLSSDTITNTFSKWKRYQSVIEQIDPPSIDNFKCLRYTIAGFTIFPRNKVENRPTINSTRGMSFVIGDRFDLTLECIRRLYKKIKSPLTDCLNDYWDFFDLFVDFGGYIEFFLLQDLANENEINFLHPFDNFKSNPLPQTAEEYLRYMNKNLEFLNKRNQRIKLFDEQIV